MVKRLTLCAILLLCSCANEEYSNIFSSDSFLVHLDDRAYLVTLSDAFSEQNYLPDARNAPLLSVRVNGALLQPNSAELDSQIISIKFNHEILLKVKVEEKSTHLTFEITGVQSKEDIELAVWGPYPTVLSDTIGETVGVVSGGGYAVGIQSLNAKTLGGYPWSENDCMPQIDIFEQDDFTDMSEEGKRHVLYRVEAAKPTDYGSSLQAYCRNKSERRIVDNLGNDYFVSPRFFDQYANNHL